MKIKRRPTILQKMARRGFRGNPVATVAFYGPDDRRASKVAVGISLGEGEEVSEMKSWQSDTSDLRADAKVGNEIVEFIKSKGALSVAVADRIIGCPHEEGIDYPEGQTCPECPFWEKRDRWTGELLPEM